MLSPLLQWPFCPAGNCRRRAILVFVAALAGRGALPAHESPVAGSKLGLTIWQSDSGLPQNTVQAIAQTRDGHLWIGTKEGLARFNGAEFVCFNENNTPAFTNSSITALLAGTDGSLWIGTDGGGLVRLKDGQFRCYSTEQELLSKRIRSLRAGPDGSLWIGSTGGINRLHGERFTGYTMEQGLLSKTVRALALDSAGTVWIGTAKGTNRLRAGRVEVDASKRRLKSNSIRALLCDRTGALWIATNAEVECQRPGSIRRFTAEDGITPDTIDCIYEDRHGTVWFGTNDGLFRYERDKFVGESAGGALQHAAILTLAEDREGNLWLGTHEGLMQIRTSPFSALTIADGLAHNVVNCVTEDRQGRLWIGTMGGGLNRLQDGRLTVLRKTDGLISDRVTALRESRDGSLWLGFDTAGLSRLENNLVVSYPSSVGAPDSPVNVIYEDRHGTLWLGTRSGIATFRDGEFTSKVSNFGGSGNIVRAIVEDRDGALWIGSNRGVTCCRDGRFSTIGSEQGLSHDSVTSLHVDPAGILWIGTDGGGLNWIVDGRVRSCQTAHGLYSDTALSIAEDGLGHFWISSRQGVFRVARQELLQFGEGKVAEVTCVAYGKSDGMLAVEGSTGAKPGAWRARDGRLWFATVKGLHVVAPPQLTRNTVAPPVVITRLEFDRRNVPLTPAVRLPPGRGDLEFRYAALSFSQPEKIQYQYRLEGVDDAWIDAGNRRVANYSNVQPGRHRFRVIARNNDGVWNQAGAAFEFTLAPHFYEAWWFHSMVGAMAAGAVFGSYRWRVRTLRRREQQLAHLVDERTQDLQKEIAERRRAEEQVAAAQRELIEISRQAGMAEVATGVLHNVGNVLTSVNVSASLVIERLHDSKTANVIKLGDMLRTNRQDLTTFLTADPKGRKIPEYVITLADQIAAERKAVTEELNHLRKSIEHVRDVVAMQQGYARVSGLVETVPLAELVEDALRMNSAALSRHRIQVLRDFQPGLAVTVERHKVLQVLVNLIQNAKHACNESGRRDKELTLRIAAQGQRVRLTVSDNGIGIPPENLTRIFAHGFTTRTNGHGFGLHSGALVAKALGGSLTAQSAGRGHGAAFTLELPGELRVAA